MRVLSNHQEWNDFFFFQLRFAELLSIRSPAVTEGPRPFCKSGPRCCRRGLNPSFSPMVSTKPSPAAPSYLAFPAAGTEAGAIPKKLSRGGRGCRGFPCLVAPWGSVLSPAHRAGFLGKVQRQGHANEGSGSVLHWCSEGDPPDAPEGMAKPAGMGLSRQVWMTDFTQQEAAAVIGNLLVVLSVSYLYPIYTNSYSHIGINIFM